MMAQIAHAVLFSIRPSCLSLSSVSIPKENFLSQVSRLNDFVLTIQFCCFFF